MGIAYPGSDGWENSTERSAKLRKERKAYEKEMKGTFKQQQDRTDSRISLKGKEDRLERAMINSNSIANQRLTNKGAMNVQSSKARVDTSRINAKTPYWNAAASQANASAKLTNTKNVDANIALAHADDFYAMAASGPKKPGDMDLSGTGSQSSLLDSKKNGVAQPVIEGQNDYQAGEFGTTYQESLAAHKRERKRRAELADEKRNKLWDDVRFN